VMLRLNKAKQNEVVYATPRIIKPFSGVPVFRAITPVSRIDPHDGVTYDRDGCIHQLLKEHALREQVIGRPICRYSIEETLGMGFDALFRAMKQDGYHYAIEYWKLACGEFWRATYYSDFPYFELRRHEKAAMKKLVKLEAAMWIAALKCLKGINEKKHGWAFQYPCTNLGMALTMLIAEGQMLSWIFCSGSNVPEAKSRQQSINAKLKQIDDKPECYENPFQYGTFAHDFTARCVELKPRYPQLDDAWRELLKARSAYVEKWRNSSPVRFDGKTGEFFNARDAIVTKKLKRAKYTRKDRL
jgi:hypothetical protein